MIASYVSQLEWIKQKKMKLIKRGWKNIIENPKIFFDEKERSIKLHFDMHHGYGILEELNKINEFKRQR